MRHIGTIPDLDQAQLFADYLGSKGISVVTEPQGTEWSIWVREEDRLIESHEELTRFLLNPQDATFAVAASGFREAIKPAVEIETTEPEVPKSQLTFRQVAERAPLTVTIIGLCLFVSLLSQLGQDLGSSAVRSLAFCNPRHIEDEAWQAEADGMVDIRRGEIWRVATPAFLHFGLAHIGLNLFFLFQLGWLFESRHSTTRLALILLTCAVVGNIGQYLCESWPLFGGLAGAVCGLLAYMWIRMRVAPQEGFRVAPIALLLVIVALGLAGNLDQLANDNLGNDIKIGNWSQLFGLATGAALALILPLAAQE